MNRFQKDVYLPTPKTAEEADLYRRLADIFRDLSLVTREIQAPPICVVDLNGTDYTLLVTGTNSPNILPFVTGSAGSLDTHGWWDSASHRYVPQESGYYACSLHYTLQYPTDGIVAAGNVRSRINKNGVGQIINRIRTDAATSLEHSFSSSKIIYCNGTTDYLDFDVRYSTGSGLVLLGSFNESYGSIAFIGGVQVA